MIHIILECECCKKESEKLTRGLCNTCYIRFRRNGKIENIYNTKPKEAKETEPKEVKKCTIENCDNNHVAKGLCMKHYKWKRREHGIDK